MTTDGKRRGPAAVAPVRHGGLRHEAPLPRRPFGPSQDGGFVIARDEAMGDLAWTRRVHVAAGSHDIEGHTKDVFIRSLTLVAHGRHPVSSTSGASASRWAWTAAGCAHRPEAARDGTGENALAVACARRPPP